LAQSTLEPVSRNGGSIKRLVQRSVCGNDPRHNLTDRGIASSIGNRQSASIPVRDRIHELKQDIWRPPGTPT
jgi:hypothetical protein